MLNVVDALLAELRWDLPSIDHPLKATPAEKVASQRDTWGTGPEAVAGHRAMMALVGEPRERA